MTISEIFGEIDQILSLLLDADVAVYRTPVCKLSRRTNHGAFCRITTAPLMGPAPIVESFFSLEQYFQFVQNGDFAAVLFDGSILQLGYDFLNGEMAGHRLCYFPSPFDIDRELIRSEALGDLVDLYRTSLIDDLRLRSPLRFDYDPSNATDGHPAVHVHLTYDDCRIPVFAPLSPGHFLRFVFRSFYPGLYNAHDFIRRWPISISTPTIVLEESQGLHVHCVHATINASRDRF